MARRPNPLVPLDLFRSRAFATVNLATFFIYGGLYVTQFYTAVVLQGVLGYTAMAAGLIGIPTSIMLTLLSTRIGTVAGRIGARRFLVTGPILMSLALLWYARLPVDSDPWLASIDRPSSLVPPTDAFIDVLPYTLLFGLGISFVVAPLTSTLMGSVPGRFSGLGSAINNSISRVGQPLIGALVFIAISAAYYASLGAADRTRHERPGRPPRLPAAQPATRRGPHRPGRGRERGVDGRLPPRDDHLCRAAGRRVGRVVGGSARATYETGRGSCPGDRGAARTRLTGVSRGPGTEPRGPG